MSVRPSRIDAIYAWTPATRKSHRTSEKFQHPCGFLRDSGSAMKSYENTPYVELEVSVPSIIKLAAAGLQSALALQPRDNAATRVSQAEPRGGIMKVDTRAMKRGDNKSMTFLPPSDGLSRRCGLEVERSP